MIRHTKSIRKITMYSPPVIFFSIAGRNMYVNYEYHNDIVISS